MLRRLVFVLGTPSLLGAQLVDVVLDPLFRRAPISNTYRVLARKTEVVAS
jgi:hypothetical protein